MVLVSKRCTDADPHWSGAAAAPMTCSWPCAMIACERSMLPTTTQRRRDARRYEADAADRHDRHQAGPSIRRPAPSPRSPLEVLPRPHAVARLEALVPATAAPARPHAARAVQNVAAGPRPELLRGNLHTKSMGSVAAAAACPMMRPAVTFRNAFPPRCSGTTAPSTAAPATCLASYGLIPLHTALYVCLAVPRCCPMHPAHTLAVAVLPVTSHAVGPAFDFEHPWWPRPPVCASAPSISRPPPPAPCCP